MTPPRSRLAIKRRRSPARDRSERRYGGTAPRSYSSRSRFRVQYPACRDELSSALGSSRWPSFRLAEWSPRSRTMADLRVRRRSAILPPLSPSPSAGFDPPKSRRSRSPRRASLPFRRIHSVFHARSATARSSCSSSGDTALRTTMAPSPPSPRDSRTTGMTCGDWVTTPGIPTTPTGLSTRALIPSPMRSARPRRDIRRSTSSRTPWAERSSIGHLTTGCRPRTASEPISRSPDRTAEPTSRAFRPLSCRSSRRSGTSCVREPRWWHATRKAPRPATSPPLGRSHHRKAW